MELIQTLLPAVAAYLPESLIGTLGVATLACSLLSSQLPSKLDGDGKAIKAYNAAMRAIDFVAANFGKAKNFDQIASPKTAAKLRKLRNSAEHIEAALDEYKR